MTKTDKRAFSGEYVIAVEPDGSIRVSRIGDNSLGTLRKIAEGGGIAFDPDWDLLQLGKKIVADLGDGETAETEEYTVSIHGADARTYRVCDNAKEALRQVAGEVGFDFDNGWNTREFGNKLIDFINSPKTGDDSAAKALRDLAGKLDPEARKMGIPTTGGGLARKIASEARDMGIPTTKGGIARMAWSLLKNWLGIQIGPTGCAIIPQAVGIRILSTTNNWDCGAHETATCVCLGRKSQRGKSRTAQNNIASSDQCQPPAPNATGPEMSKAADKTSKTLWFSASYAPPFSKASE